MRLIRNTFAPLVVAALLRGDVRAQDAQKAPDAQMADAKVAGQEVGVPTRKKYVAPEYPAAAAEQGIRGIVILDVLIGETGAVVDAKVTRSIPGLDEAALAAVKLWEYEPTKVAGKLVKVRLAQSITFSFKLPDLQRAPGVPELKTGGSPPAPVNLTSPQSASVSVVLGPDGVVREASAIGGSSGGADALLRVVKSWRFVVSEGAAPISFVVRADWTPGPPTALTLRALDPKPVGAMSGAPTTEAVAQAAPVRTGEKPEAAPLAAPIPTDVLPAQAAPTTLEHGVSTIPDVILGENIPDLVKGRRPVWPPLARLGNITGQVVVRFSVDVAGKVTVHSAEGPDMLKSSAEGAVGTWLFRRTSIDRLHLIATFTFGNDRSVARVERSAA